MGLNISSRNGEAASTVEAESQVYMCPLMSPWGGQITWICVFQHLDPLYSDKWPEYVTGITVRRREEEH